MKKKKRLDRLLSATMSLFKPRYRYRMKAHNPIRIHKGIIYIVQDGLEADSLFFKCPCGCKTTICLNLLKDTRPCWSFSVKKGRITISPSIWAKAGCGSHFLIREGKVVWVR
ncbi:MAG: hypothetical protein BGO55_11735 [Sphingobacteriales bacterium 50-39]|nr:MAG: hypothetical protein BGO55_11735 [Sphingobacteriales bacterium 50-39]